MVNMFLKGITPNDYVINVGTGEHLNRIEYLINLPLNIYYVIRASYYRNLKQFLAPIGYNSNYVLVIRVKTPLIKEGRSVKD